MEMIRINSELLPYHYVVNYASNSWIFKHLSSAHTKMLKQTKWNF